MVFFQLAAFFQSASPRKNCCARVSGCFFAFQVLVVMSCNRTVSGFVLVVSVGGNKNARHHSKTAVGRCNHIGHNVAVVVFASPNKSAFGPYYSCNCVVDKSVFVRNTGVFKLLFVFVLINFCKDIFESMVVRLGNRILRGKPNVHLCGKGVVKACSCKRGNRLIRVMHTHYYAVRVFKIKNGQSFFFAVAGNYDFGNLSLFNLTLYRLVNIAICVSCNNDRLFPGGDIRSNAVNYNGRSKHSTVQNRSYSSIGGRIECFKVILHFSLRVCRNSSAFNANFVFFNSVRRFFCNFVVSVFTVDKR